MQSSFGLVAEQTFPSLINSSNESFSFVFIEYAFEEGATDGVHDSGETADFTCLAVDLTEVADAFVAGAIDEDKVIEHLRLVDHIHASLVENDNTIGYEYS